MKNFLRQRRRLSSNGFSSSDPEDINFYTGFSDYKTLIAGFQSHAIENRSKQISKPAQ